MSVYNILEFPRKVLLLLAAICYSCFTLAQLPVINTFTPASGPIGTVVNISGSNFSSIPANNSVFFGAVKAQVISSTSNSLVVSVPAGASYKNITVTVNGLTCSSLYPFAVTFPGGDAPLNQASFENEVSFLTTMPPAVIVVGDLDLDGRPDMVSRNYAGGSAFYISLLRNTSVNGNISFAPSINQAFNGASSGGICADDLDGDGKLDIITAGFPKLSLFRNLSTPGNISLSSPIDYPIGEGATWTVSVGDLDNDGKPDVGVLYDDQVLIYKNNSSVGNIQLLDKITIPVGNKTVSNYMKFADLDQDGRIDMAIVNFDLATISVFRNKSVPGTISFDDPISFLTTGQPLRIAIGDLDSDNKPDMTFISREADAVAVFKNESSIGNMSFTNRTYVETLYQPVYRVVNGDVNGDGKIDIGAISWAAQTISIIKNNSTPCNFKFQQKIDYDGTGVHELVISDLNGDGKPEIIKNGADAIEVHKNNIIQTIQVCAGANTTIHSNSPGTTPQWQQNTGSGFLNISDNSNFSGTTTSILQLKNIPSTWHSYKYRCITSTDVGNEFTLSVNSNYTPSLTITKCPNIICTGGTVSLTARAVNGGTSPVYQWQDSSDATGWKNISGATGSSLSYTATASRHKIRSTLASEFTCALPSTVISNVISIDVAAQLTPAITIAGSTTVNFGQAATLTATATNTGLSPLYQWQDSTQLHSWTDIAGATGVSLLYTPTLTGHKVRCRLTTSESCVSQSNVTSSAVIFKVNMPTAINPVPASTYGIRLYPNPSNRYIIIDSLKLSDKWESLEVISLDGKEKLRTQNLQNKTRVHMFISQLQKGLFVIRLKRKSGEFVYLKFVKL